MFCSGVKRKKVTNEGVKLNLGVGREKEFVVLYLLLTTLLYFYLTKK